MPPAHFLRCIFPIGDRKAENLGWAVSAAVGHLGLPRMRLFQIVRILSGE
jgi:hypothetical protein